MKPFDTLVKRPLQIRFDLIQAPERAWGGEPGEPLLTSCWVKLRRVLLVEMGSWWPLRPSSRRPADGSWVRTYDSFRLSESMSVPLRFCSVILEDEPGNTAQLSADGHSSTAQCSVM